MLDRKKLKGEEVTELKKLIDKYALYDRLGILIDITLNKLGISKQEFNSRNVEFKKEVLKFERLPSAVMYCDSDKCEVVL